jgi:hypothetical protein
MNSKQEQFNQKNKRNRHTVGGVVLPAWYMYLGYMGYSGPENGYHGYYGGEITQAREYEGNAPNGSASDVSGTLGDGSSFGAQ